MPATTTRMRRAAAAPIAIAALTVAALPATAEAAEPDPRKTRAATGCLWAGKSYPQNTTVTAGGTTFRCGTDTSGPVWSPGSPTTQPDTVPIPGATTAPIGRFSPGARQPGTSYNDYCVGNQLIPGTDDVYQVVRVSGGTLLWKAAHPISQWTFYGPPPEPTWRTASLCIDGTLT
ncbi:hypothetical protein GPX89_04015 [Nocardia sp. ET3-3]|uniref:Ig-like domain-containing protein n=1 Tax=Nocardia terrae TaxID=2675851 RepID=A0A7K1UQI0_9NOCA|nr:hypothetical protein [Nocardia terrae]MVU76409.1 hypothetical protein [Nocardia terrae]